MVYFNKVGDIEELTTKTTNKHKLKRDIEICDETGSVKCVLWGDNANRIDADSKNKIVEIKEGLIQEFQDKKHLMVSSNTILKLDDRSHKAQQLLKWFGTNQDKIRLSQKPLEHASVEYFGFNEAKERLRDSIEDSITFISDCCRVINLRIKSTFMSCSKCLRKVDEFNNNFCHNCKMCVQSPKNKIIFEVIYYTINTIKNNIYYFTLIYSF
jgi:hypothetical protein